tara:strand:+ start:615 stop:833 length:219 start_codon:yes stop_codon:yes gene_type:complete
MIENTAEVHDIVPTTSFIAHYTDNRGTRGLIPVIRRMDDPKKPLLTIQTEGDRSQLVPIPKWLEKLVRAKME